MKLLPAILASVVFCGISHAQTFVRSGVTLATGPCVMDIGIADLNDDGMPELITADRGRLSSPRDERPGNDQLSHFVATAPMKYVPQPQLRVGFGPYALKVVNVDALRAPDIVAVSFMASRGRDLMLLRNLGANLFEPVEFSLSDDDLSYARMLDGDGEPIFTIPGLTALEVYDFDGDGYRDAVASGWSSDVLVFFPGHIDRYFSTPRMIPLSGAPRDLVRGDFNRDGHQDLAVALYASGQIAFLAGDGQGRFATPVRFDSRGALPVALKTADFDDDGVADLVVAHSHSDDSLVIFRGSGDGNFAVSQEILLGVDRGAIEAEIRGLVVEDFDGNGRPDIAVTCYRSRQLVVLLSERTDSFPLNFSKETYPFTSGRPRAVACGDLDGDGKKDLAVSVWDTNRLEFFMAR